jgi:ATP-dependent RNA helicase DeaD
VKPGNIVGAIANEAGVDSRNIGRVDIRDDHSLVDLPAGMPDNILQHLKQVWVVGQQLRIVEEGKPFDPPRKPGKLALAGDKPRFNKPKFEKSKPGSKRTKTPNRKTPNRGLP